MELFHSKTEQDALLAVRSVNLLQALRAGSHIIIQDKLENAHNLQGKSNLLYLKFVRFMDKLEKIMHVQSKINSLS